jgi:hypothetical protein
MAGLETSAHHPKDHPGPHWPRNKRRHATARVRIAPPASAAVRQAFRRFRAPLQNVRERLARDRLTLTRIDPADHALIVVATSNFIVVLTQPLTILP